MNQKQYEQVYAPKGVSKREYTQHSALTYGGIALAWFAGLLLGINWYVFFIGTAAVLVWSALHDPATKADQRKKQEAQEEAIRADERRRMGMREVVPYETR